MMDHLSADFLKELQVRRQRLVGIMPASSIVILPSGRLMFRNGDTEYPFRQNSNFYYLTGFCEPDSVMVFTKNQTGQFEYILFCKSKHPEEEVWTGPKAGLEGARKIYGADKAFEIEELDDRMPGILSGHNHFLYSLGVDFAFDSRVMNWVNALRSKTRKGGSPPDSWLDLNTILHRFRLKKSPYEIDCLRKAAEISGKAHLQLMQNCQPGLKEYQLEGEFLAACFSQGQRAMAYPPIVAAGKNACILHYTKNEDSLRAGDLLLVDAGCEYQYYAADITRTFPISGRFSESQEKIYNLVLKSQQAAIHHVRPGVAWNTLQDIIVPILVEGLIDLGILQGSYETLMSQKAYQRFYMHSSGHWLGLDVHDAGEYKVNDHWCLFEPGHVLTIEPGLYIAPHQKDIDEKWWGIGVRIEDDVLVTEQGCEVLSKSVPKTVEEIEAVMALTRSSGNPHPPFGHPLP